MPRPVLTDKAELQRQLDETASLIAGLQAQIDSARVSSKVSDVMAPVEEPKKERVKKEPKKKQAVDKEPKKDKEMTALDIASSREKTAEDRLESLMSGYMEDLLPDYAPIARKGDNASFCMPPSVKEAVAKKMQTMVGKRLEEMESRREKGMPFAKQEADVLTGLYVLAEDIKRIPTCEAKELEDMFNKVREEYPEQVDMTFEAMLDAISDIPTVQTEKQTVKARKELEEQIEVRTQEIVDAMSSRVKGTKSEKEAVAREQAISEVMKDAVLQGRSQFISKWHAALSKRLQGYLYDGAEGQGEEMPSPCGLRIPMKGLEAISKAEDLLAFLGSKKDWEQFYIEGEEDIETETGKDGFATFHRMHAKDWPGCIADVFAQRKILTSEVIGDIVREVNKKHNLKLKVEDFVEDDELPKGYGFQ